MAWRKWIGMTATMCVGALGFTQIGRAAEPLTKPSKLTLTEWGTLLVDGKPVFPITLTVIPGPDAKAPNGKHAYEQFADDGAMFMRTGGPAWGADGVEKEAAYQRAAAEHGMRCSPWLGWELSNFNAGEAKKEAQLKRVIETFRNSPGMGLWKGADEPEWGNEHDAKKSTPEQVANVARIIHENDPLHPIWLVQAPRGTVASMKRYNNGWDVGGIDIYPISYPPGVHSEEKNKELSMVGDWTRMMREVGGHKPFWMTLQIAFSGVAKPGRTLRFPTFAEQRFMAYEAIINGSRGLTYFGGGIPQTLNERDKVLGFNWTYWDRVMVQLLEEIGPKSPIEPALIAPDSKIRLTVAPELPPKRKVATKAEEENKNAPGSPAFVQDQAGSDASSIEWLVREAGNDVYVLACKKEGPTLHVKFGGLPSECAKGSVVFEEPRTVETKDGSFSDWFGPFEVHVYKFSRK